MTAHPRIYLATILFLVGQLISGSGVIFAQGPVILTDEVILTDGHPLGLHLETLEDPSKQLTIDQVTSSHFDRQFVASQEKVPNFGYTTSAIWTRFWVRNETTQTTDWRLVISDPTIDLIDFYMWPLPSNPNEIPDNITAKQTGDLAPFASREVEHHNFVFRLPLELQTDYVMYLRAENRGSTPLPLTLWSTPAFAQHNYRVQFGFGFLYGFIFIMVCYNLFLFIFLRDKAYLYYVLCVASLGLYTLSLNGLARQYLWPNQIWWGDVSILVFIGLALWSGASFGSYFLQVKTYSYWLDKGITAIKILSAGLIVLGFFPNFYRVVGVLMAILTIFTVFMGLAAGVVSWRHKYYPARYFLAAWGGILGGALLVVLGQFGILPVGFITEYGLRIGLFLLVLLLSLALADRINLLKAETERANQRLRENEDRLHQFLEMMPVGVSVIDNQTKIQYINQRAKEILNITGQAVQSRTALAELIARSPIYIAGTDEKYPFDHLPFMQALQGKSVNVDDIEITLPDKRIPLEIWTSPILDEQGEIYSAILVFQDITKRQQIASELNKYQVQLEEMVTKRTDELAAVNEQLQQDIERRQQAEKSLQNSHQQLQETNERLAVIHELGQMITSQLQLDTVLDILAQSTAKLLGKEAGAILLVDEASQALFIKGAYGLSECFIRNARYQLDEGIAGQVAQTGQPIIINDLPNHPTFYTAAAVDEGLLACASVPLIVGKKIIGTLDVQSRTRRHAFDEGQIYFLQMLAAQAAVVIENARLFEEERKAKETVEMANAALNTLNTIAFSVNNTLDLEADLEHALEMVLQEMKLDHGWIFLPETNGRYLRLAAAVGFPEKFRRQEVLTPVGYCICEEVLTTGQGRSHFEENVCPRLTPYAEHYPELSTRHISLPIFAKQEIVGLLNLGGDNILNLTPENYEWLETVGQQVGNAIENATLYQNVLDKAERLAVLNRVSTIVSLSWDLDEVLPPLLREMARILETSLGVLVLRSEENKDRYRVRARFGYWHVSTDLDAVPWHELSLLKVIEQTQAPLMMPTAAGDKRLQPLAGLIEQEKIQTVLILPLVVQNQLTGFIQLCTLGQERIFESAEIELARTLTNQAALAIEKARLYEATVARYEQELEIARQIQQNLLPHTVPQIPGLRIAGLCQPAYATGGDFYDYILLPDHRLGIVVSDVTGKSLPAAMVMALARNTVRSELVKHSSPAEAMTAANQWLFQDTQHNTFVATVQALIAPSEGSMWLVNAGQTATLLLRNGRTSYLLPEEAVGFPLGIEQNLRYAQAQIPLQAGDTLLFYTDGIVEAKNTVGDMFGFDRLETTFQKLQNGFEPKQVIDYLMTEIQDFVGEAEQHDDITLVVVQVE